MDFIGLLVVMEIDNILVVLDRETADKPAGVMNTTAPEIAENFLTDEKVAIRSSDPRSWSLLH